MSKQKSTDLYMYLNIIYISCLLISNIIAGRLFQFGKITLPSAIILFPITYIVGDIVVEVYGFKKSRKMTSIALLVCFFSSIVLYCTTKLPIPVDFINNDAYSTVFGIVPRTMIASFSSFYIGNISNAALMSIIKKVTNSRLLFVRTILSTLVGEALDSIVFITVTFYNILPHSSIMQMILFQYFFKVAYEIIFTPILYGTVRLARNITSKNSI